MEKDTLLIKPIKFTNIRYIGNTGSDWIETEYNLSKLITQNILYTAYHNAKSIDEISSLLGLEKRIVENEIDYLEDNGYIIMAEKDKYLSQIIIDDFSTDILEKRDKLFTKYALAVYDEYISKISAKSLSLYTPNGDQNFLLWSIITILCFQKISRHIKEVETTNLIKRYDGSENIPYTALSSYENKKSYVEYELSLKTPKGYKFSIFQTNSIYDDRHIDWCRIFQQEYTDMYEYLMNQDKCNPDSLKRLLDIGYLVPDSDDNYYANMIVSDISKNDCIDLLPPIPDKFVTYNRELSKELGDLCCPLYPSHIRNFANILYQKTLTLGEIILKTIEIALENKLLKPLTEDQRKTVNMVLFLK